MPTIGQFTLEWKAAHSERLISYKFLEDVLPLAFGQGDGDILTVCVHMRTYFRSG